jgi:integrase
MQKGVANMAFNPSYIQKSRHGIYYLRYPIPVELTPSYKRDYIIVSLQTYVRKEALAYADGLRYITRNFINQLCGVRMNYIEKKKLIQQHIKQVFEQEKQRILSEGLYSEDRVSASQVLLNDLERIEINNQRGLSVMDLTPFHTLCDEADVAHERNSPDYIEMEAEYRRATIKLNRDILAFNETVKAPDYLESQPAPLASKILEPKRQAQPAPLISGELLHGVMDKYFSEHEHTWENVTKVSYTTYSKLILKVISPTFAMEDFNLLTQQEVRDAVQKLNNGNATKNAYLRFYASFFLWAKRQGYTNNTFFEKVDFPPEKNAVKKREFKVEEMQAMNAELMATKDKLKPHNFWVTQIAIYTGARISEITQLTISDIHQVDGIWVIEITNDGDMQKVKTERSIRAIPIHSQLIELGLLDYLAQRSSAKHPDALLFPDLPYNPVKKNRSRNVSRWFNDRFLVKLGIKSKEVDFHSFRRTLTTKLAQAGVQEAHISVVLGHATTSITQRYNTGGYTLKQKQEAIEMFNIN